MAHGAPDWNRSSGLLTTFQLKDLGELAARLGAMSVFDRRGDLVWSDDFEAATAKWLTVTDGVGAASARTTTNAWRGAASWLLTTGNAEGDSANMNKALFTAPVGPMGLELRHAVATATDLSTRIVLSRRADLVENVARITVDYDSGEVSFLADDLSETLITTQDFLSNSMLWYQFKFVVDFNLNEYVRAIINHETFDLSGTPLFSQAVAAANTINPSITAIAGGAAARTVFVDDVLITQNEP